MGAITDANNTLIYSRYSWRRNPITESTKVKKFPGELPPLTNEVRGGMPEADLQGNDREDVLRDV